MLGLAGSQKKITYLDWGTVYQLELFSSSISSGNDYRHYYMRAPLRWHAEGYPQFARYCNGFPSVPGSLEKTSVIVLSYHLRSSGFRIGNVGWSLHILAYMGWTGEALAEKRLAAVRLMIYSCSVLCLKSLSMWADCVKALLVILHLFPPCRSIKSLPGVH